MELLAKVMRYLKNHSLQADMSHQNVPRNSLQNSVEVIVLHFHSKECELGEQIEVKVRIEPLAPSELPSQPTKKMRNQN